MWTGTQPHMLRHPTKNGGPRRPKVAMDQRLNGAEPWRDGGTAGPPLAAQGRRQCSQHVLQATGQGPAAVQTRDPTESVLGSAHREQCRNVYEMVIIYGF